MRTAGHILGHAYGAAATMTGRETKIEIMKLDISGVLKQDMTMARIVVRGLPPVDRREMRSDHAVELHHGLLGMIVTIVHSVQLSPTPFPSCATVFVKVALHREGQLHTSIQAAIAQRTSQLKFLPQARLCPTQ